MARSYFTGALRPQKVIGMRNIAKYPYGLVCWIEFTVLGRNCSMMLGVVFDSRSREKLRNEVNLKYKYSGYRSSERPKVSFCHEELSGGA